MGFNISAQMLFLDLSLEPHGFPTEKGITN